MLANMGDQGQDAQVGKLVLRASELQREIAKSVASLSASGGLYSDIGRLLVNGQFDQATAYLRRHEGYFLGGPQILERLDARHALEDELAQCTTKLRQLGATIVT
jgi:hypothetical protein